MKGDTAAGKPVRSATSSWKERFPRRRGFIVTFPDGTSVLWDFGDGGLVDVWIVGERTTSDCSHATRLPPAVHANDRGFYNDQKGGAPVGIALSSNRL